MVNAAWVTSTHCSSFCRLLMIIFNSKLFRVYFSLLNHISLLFFHVSSAEKVFLFLKYNVDEGNPFWLLYFSSGAHEQNDIYNPFFMESWVIISYSLWSHVNQETPGDKKFFPFPCLWFVNIAVTCRTEKNGLECTMNIILLKQPFRISLHF